MAGTSPAMTKKVMLTVAPACVRMSKRGTHSMRAWITLFAALVALAAGASAALAGGRSSIPVYPPYPYKAGHYPTADSYYDMPPYAAIDPSIYCRRHFLMAQERSRYRYIPHIFRGYVNGDGLK
jgi:hypothetical protein